MRCLLKWDRCLANWKLWLPSPWLPDVRIVPALHLTFFHSQRKKLGWTLFSQEAVFHVKLSLSLSFSLSVSLKALKHFLPLLMDFYSTFQSWSTFIAFRFASEILIHFTEVISVLFTPSAMQHSAGHYMYPVRHDWYLNMNVAQSGLFLNVSWTDITLCVCVRVCVCVNHHHSHPFPAHHPWTHLCSECLLWFWVPFNGWESKNSFGMPEQNLWVWAQGGILKATKTLPISLQAHTAQEANYAWQYSVLQSFF